jgi:hypothetical protein
MAVYGPGCHPQNIIWTEAKLRYIYYFVGDRPVHKLPFGPIHANLRQKASSDKIRKKTLY